MGALYNIMTVHQQKPDMSDHLAFRSLAATFLTSATQISQLPVDEGQEVAFLGRSNAGKSSMINALCGNPKLARTSKTPGRTQMLNFFSVGEGRRLVDLPGLGYAEVSRDLRQRWQQLIDRYLAQRQSLTGMIYLSDIRHPLLAIDMEAIDRTLSYGVRVAVALTKADKLSNSQRASAINQTAKRLAAVQASVDLFAFSSKTHYGMEDLAQATEYFLNSEKDQ